jgi:hypothetical protein
LDEETILDAVRRKKQQRGDASALRETWRIRLLRSTG